MKPTYQSNPPISQIYLSVKSTYQSNPPISQIYLSVKSTYLSVTLTCLSVKFTCLSVKSTYQSNPPVSQSDLPISQIHLSQIYLSVKSPVYKSNPPISQIHLSVKSPVYQSNPPISQIHLSVKSTCQNQPVHLLPPRQSQENLPTVPDLLPETQQQAQGVSFSPKQLPTLTHTKKGVQITRPLMFLYRARSARWHTANGWRRKHKAWLRTLAQTN